jgi:hypothetical protein
VYTNEQLERQEREREARKSAAALRKLRAAVLALRWARSSQRL